MTCRRLIHGLRVNDLKTGDVDGDGRGDILFAGRTFVGGTQKGALGVWSQGRVYFHAIDTANKSRMRSILSYQASSSKQPIIVVGGRQDYPLGWAMHLSTFRLGAKRLEPLATYECPTATFYKLRRLTVSPDGKHVFGVGRHCMDSVKDGRWRGFVTSFSITEDVISPASRRHYWTTDYETRVRSIAITSQGDVLTAGFVKDESKKKTKGTIDLFEIGR